MNEFTPEQEKWLTELESGKHKQGRGKLFDGEAYCCLGVAERFVANVEPIRTEPLTWFFGDEDTYLQQAVMVQLLVRTKAGTVEEAYGREFYSALQSARFIGRRLNSLAGYNDQGATFFQIAAAIRAVPHAVFTNFEEPQCTYQ